jgi:hypothetical protein
MLVLNSNREKETANGFTRLRGGNSDLPNNDLPNINDPGLCQVN